MEYLNIVIPAPHQVRDKLQPESRLELDAGRRSRVQRGSVIPDLIRDRHDGISLSNCRDNILKKFERMVASLDKDGHTIRKLTYFEVHFNGIMNAGATR